MDEPTWKTDDFSSVGEDIEAINEGPSRLEIPLLVEPLVVVHWRLAARVDEEDRRGPFAVAIPVATYHDIYCTLSHLEA